jgi:MFS family permease
VEKLARVGLVAQGVSFALVAVLAIQLALGEGGEATDRQGALRTIAHDPLGRVLVIALALGFAAYVCWRLLEAVREEKLGKRISALGKAVIYVALCAAAVSVLLGESRGGDEEREATKGILGWPAGRWIVGAIAAGIAIAALWNFYRALSGQYKKSLETEEMSSTELTWTSRIAFAGLMSRAVVFGLVSWFFFKAAVEYDPKQARGLDGALRKLATASYGPWLLGIVAAGLFAFAVFCFIQVRFREI